VADADVPITAGSGTKIDTRTVGAGTDEHRQVVVVGDPTTAANVGAVSAAGRLSVDASGVAVPVTDNSGSLTVDSTQWPAALVGGRLDVNIGASGLSSLAVANIETLVDNAGFTDGASKVFPQGYIFDETAGTGLTENDVAAARIDSKRAIVNVIEDATTRGRRAIVTAESALLNAGDTAHDAVDAGNPVKTGAKASWPAIPTLVASADRTNNWSDLGGAQVVRKRPVAMYSAHYRLANATAGNRVLLTAALTANTNKQIATIYHAGSATKRVQIKYVEVNYISNSVAGVIELELTPLSATTAPATGNPAITPGKHDPGDAAAEATCLAIPTTQGSVVNADQTVGIPWAENLGITGAVSTLSPPPQACKVVLWDSRADGDGKDLIIRAGSAEGYAINVRASATPVVALTAAMIFTEE